MKISYFSFKVQSEGKIVELLIDIHNLMNITLQYRSIVMKIKLLFDYRRKISLKNL